MQNEPFRPLVIVPAELEFLDALPGRLEEAGFAVRQMATDDRAELTRLVPQADVFVASLFLGIDRALLEQAARLRGVVSLIVGVDTIDVAACTERGLLVANGAIPENTIGHAEATVMLMVALLKQLKPRKAPFVRAPGDPRPARDT